MTAAAAEQLQFEPLLLADAVRAAVSLDAIRAHAKQKCLWPWWESDDPYVVFPAQIIEPVLLIPFDRLQQAAELVLGRDVHVVEFQNPAALAVEWEELKNRVHSARVDQADWCE